MEHRLLQLQSESSERIRQLNDDVSNLQQDKASLEERLKIAILSMAPLRSMASSSSSPHSLCNEPDSKHSTRRNDRRGGVSSPSTTPSQSDDREASPVFDTPGKYSRHAMLALERRVALAEASLKQAELREAATAESHALELQAANNAKVDEAAAREEAERQLHHVLESKRQLLMQVCSFHFAC
jgi:hypothetical protein